MRRVLAALVLALALAGGAEAQIIGSNPATEPEPKPHPAPKPAPASEPGFSIAGTWTSNWGSMQLAGGTNISGSYSHQGGIVSGVLKGYQFDGYWSQSLSAKRCASAELGNYYWGRLSVRFAADGRSFSGTWSYCDGPLGEGSWTGSR